jgi:predicted ester cyclase
MVSEGSAVAFLPPRALIPPTVTKFRNPNFNVSGSERFCYPSAHGGPVMSEANKQLVRRWFEEVWNKQREEAIDEMFSPDGKVYGFPEPDSEVGLQEFKDIYRNFVQAFPDIHIKVRSVISEDDRVAVTWTATMTHLGEGLGFAPTMKKESLEGCSILDVSGYQIQKGWNYMELHALMHRLKANSDVLVGS